jgi:predicted CoA-substrate-specific enzyme activase
MAKFAVMDNNVMVRLAALETIPFYKRFGRIVGDELLLDLPATGLFSPNELADAAIVVTGYGRNTINLHGARVVSEIRAHVAGAIFQTEQRDFTLLDMGGQDTKVAQVRGGRLTDFAMNDKCAASSGRYLENMAAILDITVDELSRYDEEPVELASTCGIFGESELIGEILRGHPLPRLCAGINQTLARRVLPMLRRFASPIIVVTGGVARNEALLRIIRRESGATVIVPAEPQHNGAIGCATM